MIVSIFFIILGLTAEIISLPLWSGILDLAIPIGWWFGIWHLIAAILSGFGGKTLLPDVYRQNRAQAFFFIMILVLCVPLLGGIGLLFGLMLGLRWPRWVDRASYARVEIPVLPHQPYHVSAEPQYGTGGLLSVLLDAPDPDRRVRALMSTRQMPSSMAVPILQTGLHDSADDVRLLAYSMLERIEQRINDRIRYFRSGLSTILFEQQATVQRTLAELYWELAYLGLTQGLGLANVLKHALNHADTALSLASGDAAVHFLRGRILLRQNKLEDAETAFVTALEAGLAPDDVLPYQAEVAFLRRDFASVQRYLGRVQPFQRRNPPLSDVAEYWL